MAKAENLTDSKIHRAKYDPKGPKQQFLWDSQIPGLGLEMVASGRKSWVLAYRIAEKRKRITLARYPEKSLESARIMAREHRDGLSGGVDPKVTRRIASVGTVRELHDEYIATRHYQSLSPDFKNNFGSTMRRYVLPFLGDTALEGVERQHIRQIVDNLVADGKPGMAQGCLTHCRVLFSYAIDREYRTDSPCDRVRVKAGKTKAESGRKKWLSTNEELKQAWWFNGKPAVRALLRWALLTGCRRDEARLTEKTWVDREAGTWTVPSTKNSRELVLPLTDEMLVIADEMEAAYPWSKYLFPATTDGKDKPIPRGSMDYLLRTGTKGQWSTHTLRHTVKSWMQELMIPKEWRDLVQNHFDNDMDRIYGHSPQLELKRQALEKWHAELTKRVR